MAEAPGRVVVVGDILTDVVAVLSGPLATGSDTAATITVGGGGQAANTAAWLARLGVPVTLVGAVGADGPGDARLAELAAAGVGCAAVRRAGVGTGSVVVLVDGVERTMVTDRGATLTLAAADIDASRASKPEATHLH
ncbi:MAG TPA: PfkB family carbohydrate kinase, partial [Pilimelia sp.]|nr:PfkB family carbohydrate kinase [Pilimelia sp.]